MMTRSWERRRVISRFTQSISTVTESICCFSNNDSHRITHEPLASSAATCDKCGWVPLCLSVFLKGSDNFPLHDASLWCLAIADDVFDLPSSSPLSSTSLLPPRSLSLSRIQSHVGAPTASYVLYIKQHWKNDKLNRATIKSTYCGQSIKLHTHTCAHKAPCKRLQVYLFCFFHECVYCFLSLLVYGVCVTPWLPVGE